ncbi:MAG: DUF3089 domain-containing protein [Alphaproteobacteria bacterium]|nr:DUF3089 domain-containing protein [Alphaproteobacteria bacterium]
MAKHKTAPAAKFLLAIAAMIVLILIGGIIYTSNQMTMLRIAFVPSHPIAEEPLGAAPDYTSEAAWAALPGKSSNATQLPEGVMQIAQVPEADVFYIHPTTYLNKAGWNAPYDGDEDAMRRVANFALRYQASAFSLAGQVYAPHYRQATFGSFFDDSGQGVQAILRAHADVLNAFNNFINTRNDGRPFILAGHSQGALHALLLLKERIAGTELKDRMVAAYIIGWPVGIKEDIGALDGIAGCKNKSDTGCILSFQSFDNEGDPAPIKAMFAASPGLSGNLHTGDTMLCTNPLNWEMGGAATRKANIGSVEMLPEAGPTGEPIVGLTGARCGKQGILFLTRPPQGSWREYLMAGGNYHGYDYNLFYMNIRQNAATRTKAWLENNQ